MSIEAVQKFIEGALAWPGYIWAFPLSFVAVFLWWKMPEEVPLFWKIRMRFPNQALWLVGPAVGALVCELLLSQTPVNWTDTKWRRVNIALGVCIGFVMRFMFVVIIKTAEKRFPSIAQAMDGSTGWFDKGKGWTPKFDVDNPPPSPTPEPVPTVPPVKP